MKKFKLTKNTFRYHGVALRKRGETLYQIQAIRDFSDIKKGDLGGFIRSEDNLSHKGDCWVFDDAWISKREDYFYIGNCGFKNKAFTAYKTKEGIECNISDFEGTLEDFKDSMKIKYKGTKYYKEYKLVIKLAKIKLGK